MSPLKSSKPFLEKIKKQISDNLPIYFLRQGVGARFAVLFPKYRVRLDTGCRQSWSVDWVEIGGTTNHQSANRHRHPICQIRNPDLPPSLCINPVHPRTISISGRWALTSRSPIRSVCVVKPQNNRSWEAFRVCSSLESPTGSSVRACFPKNVPAFLAANRFATDAKHLFEAVR